MWRRKDINNCELVVAKGRGNSALIFGGNKTKGPWTRHLVVEGGDLGALGAKGLGWWVGGGGAAAVWALQTWNPLGLNPVSAKHLSAHYHMHAWSLFE